MKNKDVFTFQVKKSIARGALYLLIFISMVDHAVTLIYDPEGRIERMRHQLQQRNNSDKRSPASKDLRQGCLAAEEHQHLRRN